MAAANGVVTAEAKAAFERALTHDGKHPKARFFLGVAAHQDGQGAKAAAIWRDMLQRRAARIRRGCGMVRQALGAVHRRRARPRPARAPRMWRRRRR